MGEELFLYNPEEKYANDEIAVFNIELRTDKIMDIYTYETEGFNFWYIGREGKIVTVNLKQTADASEHYLSFSITFEDDSILTLYIYGIRTEQGMFISDTSYYVAREKYYEYKLNNNLMTVEEYREIKNIVPIENYNENYFSLNNRSSSVSANSVAVTVQGYAFWQDDNKLHIFHPLKQMVVYILGSGINLITSTVTNANGFYSIQIPLVGGESSITIRIYPAGINSEVLNGLGEPEYYEQQIISINPDNLTDGDVINVPNFEIDMSTYNGQAFQIAQAVIMCSKYMKELTGNDIADVKVNFPHLSNNSGCYYVNNNRTIYIKDKSSIVQNSLHPYSSWDVIMHEYGHHVQNIYEISSGKGGTHNSDFNLADWYKNNSNDGPFNDSFPHNEVNSKKAGDWIAWSEGWATFFGTVVQQYYSSELANINYVGDSLYTAYNGRNYDLENISTSKAQGESNEYSVMCVLYDLYDSYSSNESEKIGVCNDESFDEIGLDHAPIWVIINTYKPKTLSEFVNICAEHYNSTTINNFKMAKILQAANVSPKLNTISVLTHNPPVFTWQSRIMNPNPSNPHFVFNRFDLEFYDDSGTILSKRNLTGSSYKLTASEWNTILNTDYNTFSVHLRAYQVTGNYVTGGYITELISYIKPSGIYENVNYTSATQYWEDIEYVPALQYKDYCVTFARGGNMMFQTLGPSDTFMRIISEEGEVTAFDDDAGYGANSLILQSVEANKTYTVRVTANQTETAGFKLLIIPAAGARMDYNVPITYFEDIMLLSTLNYTSGAVYIPENEVVIVRVQVQEDGMYTIGTDMLSSYTGYIDTYLYETYAGELYMYSGDDDSGGNGQASMTQYLYASKTYILVVCTKDIGGSGSVNLKLQRVQ